MYLNIGGDFSVRGETIVGVFDLDNTSCSKWTRKFLAEAQKAGAVVDAPDELPKSFLVAAEYGQTVDLPLTYTAPDVIGEDALFQDVLGEYETKHNTNENRNNNLRLLCQALNGHIVQPGETFSYNEVVGERTAEKGYLPAPAYSGNRLVDSIGGGVWQGSTTLYNCVLLADLEVVFRACHGAKVTYVPPGLDATVNYLTTDFQIGRAHV